MFRTIIALLFALGLSLKARSQHFTVNDDFQKAYSLLLDLKFAEADKRIQKLKTSDPNNFSAIYLEDLSDFLFIVVTEDQQQFEQRKELRSERLKAFDRLPDNSPYKLLAEGELHLHWAFSMMRFGEYLNGAREINKAFHLLEKNMEKYPEFLPTYKGMGLLHTLIGTVPDNYRWATKLMGVDGTISQGVGEMEIVINKTEGNEAYHNLRKETFFLLSFLYINLLNDADGLNHIAEKVSSETGPLMDFANASLLRKAAKTDEAIKILLTAADGRKAFPYLNFLLGEMKLSRMDKDACIYFREYIRSFKGKSYVKSAYQKLAWHVLLAENNEKEYRNLILRIDGIGSAMVDEDRSAQKEFESGIVPNRTLLKARLQFDGGYFKEALSTLVNSPKGSMRNTDENLEFTYRLGRIHHELGNMKEAINYYKLTIERGAESKRYFAANSSLMLGYIYEEQGKRELALKAFEACSEFENSEYKNSINQKAKAGILRLQN